MPHADAWDMKRAAEFLGVSPRTLERWVAQRLIPGIVVYPPARPDAATGKKGSKPIIAFDPDALAAWRDQHTTGKLRSAQRRAS